MSTAVHQLDAYEEHIGRVAVKTNTIYRTPDRKDHYTLAAAHEHLRLLALEELFGRAGAKGCEHIAQSIINLNRDEREALARLLTKKGEEL